MGQEKYSASEEKIKKVEVRELAPEQFWGGSVSLGELSEDEFSQKIGEAATESEFSSDFRKVMLNIKNEELLRE